MRFAAFLLLSAALGACGETISDDPEPVSETSLGSAPEASPAPAPAPAPKTLEGAWRVAGIDGASLDEPYGIALTADSGEIWWEPRCAGMVLGYTIAGNDFSTGSRTSTPPAASSTPAPVCTVALPPRLHEVTRALRAADRIEITPSNGILISGGGHSLTLYSQ